MKSKTRNIEINEEKAVKKNNYLLEETAGD
jgi:hypothetical protein